MAYSSKEAPVYEGHKLDIDSDIHQDSVIWSLFKAIGGSSRCHNKFVDLREVSERWDRCCRCHMKTAHTLRFFMGLTTQLQGKMFFFSVGNTYGSPCPSYLLREYKNEL
jgi:hypothetical protein